MTMTMTKTTMMVMTEKKFFFSHRLYGNEQCGVKSDYTPCYIQGCNVSHNTYTHTHNTIMAHIGALYVAGSQE